MSPPPSQPDVPSLSPFVVEAQGVCVTLSRRPILRDVSFSIAAGEFTGLIGSNGAGKTTLLRVLLGLQATTAGRVCSGGVPLSVRSSSIGYVPQKVVLDPDLPLRAHDVIALGIDGHRYGLPVRRRRHRATVDELLAAVDGHAFAGARVGELSGGEQQRILIAQALAGNPRLLLLDEPLANLDIRSGHQIVSLLARIATERRIAVLLSAHDMNPLLPVMHKILYLAGGRAMHGTTGEVVQSDVLSRLYGHDIDVLHVRDRILVVSGESDPHDSARAACDKDADEIITGSSAGRVAER